MNGNNFSAGDWTQKLEGTLGENLAVTFPDYPELMVILTKPERGWGPHEGCVIANWKNGAVIQFSAMMCRDGTWGHFSIYAPETHNGANFPLACIRVEGWNLVIANHTIHPQEPKLSLSEE